MADSALTSDEAEKLRAFERRRHDELANGFADFLTPVTRNAIGPLLRAARAGPGQTLLDVATGPGSVARAAAARGLRAHGIDLSSAMVALARSLHSSIPFAVADAEHLPYPDGSLDVVVCSLAWPLPLPGSSDRGVLTGRDAWGVGRCFMVERSEPQCVSRDCSARRSPRWM